MSKEELNSQTDYSISCCVVVADSHCIICGKPDGGIPWQLTPIHPICRLQVTEPDSPKPQETND